MARWHRTVLDSSIPCTTSCGDSTELANWPVDTWAGVQLTSSPSFDGHGQGATSMGWVWVALGDSVAPFVSMPPPPPGRCLQLCSLSSNSLSCAGFTTFFRPFYSSLLLLSVRAGFGSTSVSPSRRYPNFLLRCPLLSIRRLFLLCFFSDHCLLQGFTACRLSHRRKVSHRPARQTIFCNHITHVARDE